ncbi:hypothetical protein PF010_g17910 [Phytophthora fragariae]|nr:hypothetical protein PF003_g2868 [Phytophthora fragariae]KAE8930096.1 hypothetical protein PF009_g19807 [Phytophthora fragariae]KAE8991865.1 hypothetical protein PF011_g17770 [Phytophthora fragariae]KAE9091246.1 hypothetical protein PF007_g18956 [Phytophthora fragariae]KAE9092167.1 hypothetical protein PF010_g17910 [Phytophthora fragariae]
MEPPAIDLWFWFICECRLPPLDQALECFQLSSSCEITALSKTMPNCGSSSSSRMHRMHAKTNSVRAREALAMSVIMEEPPNESRLKDQEKHPGESRTRPHTGHDLASPTPESPVSTSQPELQSRSTSSSASTALTSSEDGYEQHHNAGQVSSPSRRSPSSESRPRRHRSTTTQEQEYYRHMRASHRAPSTNPERVPRSKPSHSLSSESEDEARDQHRRPPRRHAGPSSSSSTRPKASSIPPSATTNRDRERVHRQHHSAHRSATNSPSSSSDELRPRDPYEHHRASTRHGSTVPSRSGSSSRTATPHRSTARQECPSSSSSPRDASRSKANAASAYNSDQERVHRRMQPRTNASTSVSRVKSSTAKPASLSENEGREDRRLRAFRELSPPPRARSTSNPKPASLRQVELPRQVVSCRESKTMNPKLLSPSKDQARHKTSRDPSRFRSTSLLPKTAAKSLSSEGSVPRSASTSNLSSLASTPSPRSSVPRTPLRLRHYEGRLSNRRGLTLFYFCLFPPEMMAMRGVVLCLHGIGDHCRRNVALYERLCREGFGVITYDLLNHGVSDLDQHKTRAHVSNFRHLVEDTNDFIKFAKRSIYTDALRSWRNHSNTDEEPPLIIAGTSFGSLIGLHTVLSGKHKFHAAVWGSPTVGVTWNPLLWAESKLARPLAALIPTAKVVPAVQHDLLCRDPKFLARFKADPLTSMDMMTTRTGHESLQAMIQLQEDTRVTDPNSVFCAVPTLFLAGSADDISDQQAAIKFFATMGNFDKEFKLFDGLFHLVYEEPEKENVFRYLASWLHRRFPQ